MGATFRNAFFSGKIFLCWKATVVCSARLDRTSLLFNGNFPIDRFICLRPRGKYLENDKFSKQKYGQPPSEIPKFKTFRGIPLGRN